MADNFNWVTGVLIPYSNLALFLFLAVKVLKGPILGALGGRRDLYVEQLKEANRAKEEAQAMHQELADKMAKLSGEIEDIKSKAQQQAEADAAKIISDAESLAKHLTQEAQRIADAEVDKAKDSLRDEILNGVKEKVVSKITAQLDLNKQKAMFSKNLASMPNLGKES